MPYIGQVERAPVHTIVKTRTYTARLDRLGVTETERQAINDAYAADPGYGQIVRRTGGLRKGRIAKDGTGKSGGYRVFSFHPADDCPVFLLWIINKTDDDSITDRQANTFKELTKMLKEECRP